MTMSTIYLQCCFLFIDRLKRPRVIRQKLVHGKSVGPYSVEGKCRVIRPFLALKYNRLT